MSFGISLSHVNTLFGPSMKMTATAKISRKNKPKFDSEKSKRFHLNRIQGQKNPRFKWRIFLLPKYPTPFNLLTILAAAWRFFLVMISKFHPLAFCCLCHNNNCKMFLILAEIRSGKKYTAPFFNVVISCSVEWQRPAFQRFTFKRWTAGNKRREISKIMHTKKY